MKLFIILLCALVFFSLRLFLYFHFQPYPKVGEQARVSLTILQDPTISGNRQSFTASYGNFLSTIPVKIILPEAKKYPYGQRLVFSGKFSQSLYGDWQISFPKTSIAQHQYGILLFLGSIRSRIQNNFESSIPSSLADLLLGIVFGIKGNIPKDFLNALQTTGVVHIIAASGMNVTMTGEFLLGIVALVTSRRKAILIAIVGIWLYVLLAGLGSSILRAAFMVTLAMIGQFLGRQYSAFWAIGIAGVIMVGINPGVVGDIGFQLSFLSTIGILIIQPLLTTLPIVKEDVATTIAAQLATLPILLGVFGQYGLFSILVNGLILWTIPILMVLGSISAIFSLVLPIICKFILTFTIPLLWFIQSVVEYFGKLGIVVSVPSLPIPIVIGYYFLLASWIIFARVKR